uniref:Exonuclease domain-containing protein n=1 Tax=Globodera rostochiensis TaxID=31243 RepID=A0A914I9Q8_GLORO
MAFELMGNLAIDGEAKSYGIGHLGAVQAYWDRTYPDMFRLVAFDKRTGLKPIFKGENVRKFDVCVITHEGHWDGIKSVSQFFKIKIRAQLPQYRIVAYDLETTKVKGEHQPNLVSAAVTCSVCSGEEKECESGRMCVARVYQMFFAVDYRAKWAVCTGKLPADGDTHGAVERRVRQNDPLRVMGMRSKGTTEEK